MLSFTRWTIGKKCLGLTVCNTLLVLAVAGTGFWGVHSISASADRMLKNEAILAEHAAAAQNDVLELRRFEKDMFLNCLDPKKIDEYIGKFKKAHVSLLDHITELEKVAKSVDKGVESVKAMGQELEEYMKGMNGVIADLNEKKIKTSQEGNEKITPFKDTIHHLEEAAFKLARDANTRMKSVSEEMTARSRTSLATMAVFSAAALVVGLVLSSLVSRGITRPLHRMAAVMDNISAGAGDLTQQVKVESSDETGALAGMVNALIKRIHDLVVPIRVATIQLNATATQIAATAAEQNGIVQTFNASTTEIAASVKQITAAGNDLHRTMDQVRQGACDASTLADSGRSGLHQMEETMQQLSDATGSISAKLGTIREKANGINLLVTTITKVADQTNLLSINAAIEAEKAGEAGRGFLVVAREIRRLADQTAVSALDIEQMVRHMQSAVSAGVMEMDKFSERARICLVQTEEVSGQIGQILEQVHTLSERFQAVSSGMAQQNEGAGQIGEAIIQLAASVKQVSGSVKEFSSAAENLRTATQGLQREVGHFTVSA
jgi:methyl-accepting chemotaxis protein WspA